MTLLIIFVTGLIKVAATLFFLALPWAAWRKGYPGRAFTLLAIACITAWLLWWPIAIAQIREQLWWLSIATVLCAPIGVMAHRYRYRKRSSKRAS